MKKLLITLLALVSFSAFSSGKMFYCETFINDSISKGGTQYVPESYEDGYWRQNSWAIGDTSGNDYMLFEGLINNKGEIKVSIIEKDPGQAQPKVLATASGPSTSIVTAIVIIGHTTFKQSCTVADWAIMDDVAINNSSKLKMKEKTVELSDQNYDQWGKLQTTIND